MNNNTSKKQAFTTGVVYNCSALNLRAKPSITSEVIEVIPNGSIVKVYLNKSTETFYYVRHDAYLGYCSVDYIEVADNGKQ